MRLTSEPVTFQWFLDYEQENQQVEPGLRHGMLSKYRRFLRDMNHRGAGIYFTVNQTDGRGRRKENITRIRAYMIDIDGIDSNHKKTRALREIYKSPVKPSLIVQTRNGLHVYWYSTGEEPVDPVDYRRVNGRIAHALGGDMNARDISRVMRLPGFLHQKDPDNPVRVKIITEQPENIYTRDELFEAFPSFPGEEEELLQSQPAPEGGEAPEIARDGDQVRRYALGALEAECREVASTQTGGRNHALNRAAFNIARLFHQGGVTEEEAHEALHAAAKQAGLSDREINRTIQSGFRAGKANPRTPEYRNSFDTPDQDPNSKEAVA